MVVVAIEKTMQTFDMPGADMGNGGAVPYADALVQTVDDLSTLSIVDGNDGDSGKEKEENVSTADPGAFIAFKSHEDAAAALRTVGYANPTVCLPTPSDTLIDAVNDLLHDKDIHLMDMSSALPTTASAAYQALTIAGFNAVASCKKDSSAAFLVQKTKSNTPSFLFGAHWATVQALGIDTTALYVETKPLPVAYVFFRERQISIPASVCVADLRVIARIVAFEITMDASYFSCSICGTPLITHVEGDMQIAPMAITPDNRMFRRECVEEYAKKTEHYTKTTVTGQEVSSSVNCTKTVTFAEPLP